MNIKYVFFSVGNGQMDFEEFVKLMVAKNQFSFNEDEAIEAFRIFDRDCRGYVMSDELRQVFQTLEEKIPEHDINEMLQDQKHQFNRKITFDGNWIISKFQIIVLDAVRITLNLCGESYIEVSIFLYPRHL